MLKMDRPPSKYPKMAIADRAAQFSPFAALTGYEDKVKEEARIVNEKIVLDEESLSIIDKNFKEIKSHISLKPEVYVTYFISDSKKFGGIYVDEIKRIVKIDYDNSKIICEDGLIIELDDIYSIELKKD